MSNTLMQTAPGDPAVEAATSFDSAVRSAAELQTARLREFGMHLDASEREAYQRLIARLTV